MSRVFANSPGNWGSHPRLSYTKDLKKKMVLDTSLLNTQHYKVCIKGKVEQAIPGMELHPPLHLSIIAIEKGAFVSRLAKAANFTYNHILIKHF